MIAPCSRSELAGFCHPTMFDVDCISKMVRRCIEISLSCGSICRVWTGPRTCHFIAPAQSLHVVTLCRDYCSSCRVWITLHRIAHNHLHAYCRCIPEEFRCCPRQGSHSCDLREVFRGHELGKTDIGNFGRPITGTEDVRALEIKLHAVRTKNQHQLGHILIKTQDLIQPCSVLCGMASSGMCLVNDAS